MSSKNKNSESVSLNLALGKSGFLFASDIDASTVTTGKIITAIQIVEDTKFHTLTANSGFTVALNEGTNRKLVSTTVGECFTFIAGLVLYGEFTAIQLHSGAVVCYYEDK
jgi:hypothetical protein